eukprot:gene9386-14553_t
MDFDLEEKMRKHDDILRYHRERVERDQREAGLLGADFGGGLGDDAAEFVGPYGGAASPQPPPAAAQSPDRDFLLDNYGRPADLFHAPGTHTAAPSMTPRQHPAARSQPPASRAFTASSVQPRQPPVESTPAMKIKPPKTTDPLRVFNRVSQWHRRRQQKLDEERRKHDEKELENCVFRPNTQGAKPYTWEQKSGTIYGGNGRAWGYDEFVERQREARRRASEKKDVGKFTGKGWKNEVTVCQEFQLGRRDRSIRALQKPLSPPNFVPSVSQHHHLAQEVAQLSKDSPLNIFAGAGLPQRGLFSERISTAIIDNTMLHPTEEDGFSRQRRTRADSYLTLISVKGWHYWDSHGKLAPSS